MMSYGQIFLVILPVFAVFALGALLRRANWITESAEGSLFNLVVKVTTPCLIFESVVGNAALRDPRNLVFAPLAGFVLTLLGIAVGYLVGKSLGLGVGTGLRTFALTVGIANYGYIPLPLMESMFGLGNRGVLLVHNVGVEAAIWTGGVLVVSGLSLREGWKRLLNMPMLALVLGVAINLLGLSDAMPSVLMRTVHMLAVCAIPLGILMSGVSIQPHLGDPGKLFQPRVSLGAALVRLLIIPVLFLLVAKFGPFTTELKQVIIVQAAMPAAVVSIIVARVYGGQPLTAVQGVLVTTALALFTMPLWIQFGLRWVAP
jgi:predicted permease